MNYVVKRKQTRMEHAGYVASEEINKLQYAIDSRILKTEILRLILIEQKGTMNDFNSIAKKYMPMILPYAAYSWHPMEW